MSETFRVHQENRYALLRSLKKFVKLKGVDYLRKLGFSSKSGILRKKMQSLKKFVKLKGVHFLEFPRFFPSNGKELSLLFLEFPRLFFVKLKGVDFSLNFPDFFRQIDGS